MSLEEGGGDFELLIKEEKMIDEGWFTKILLSSSVIFINHIPLIVQGPSIYWLL